MAPSLTTAAAVPAPAAPVVHLNLQDGTLMPESPSESVKDVFTPVDEKHDIEISEDDRLTAYIDKDGAQVLVTWTRAEQRRVVRKADFLFLPIFTALFFWFGLDRSNISGVLTTSFLKDTGLTRDQANNGTSLLWLGIVLLEIPSNVVLHRIGAHWWIPVQVILWGLAEVLHSQIKGVGGYYTARLFLGLLESGFLPGSLYTLSRWYSRGELAKRSVIFFYGNTLSAAFGSLLYAGCLRIDNHLGVKAWQWIFIICGVSTITAGLAALLLIPSSPRKTAGRIRGKGWLSEREADIFLARLVLDDPLQGHPSTMKIRWSDIKGVLGDWRLWPHLIICLSGLQATASLNTWGATIIKSLGFTAIRANLLNVPPSILSMILTLPVAALVDRYRKYGYAVLLSSTWAFTGLVALYNLPILQKASWSFYAAYVFTLSAPAWQPIHVTWVSLNAKTPQKRAISYAVYMGCSNLGSTYGAQVFRAKDAPQYRTAFAACIALAAVWLTSVGLHTIQYAWSNKRLAKKQAAASAAAHSTSTDSLAGKEKVEGPEEPAKPFKFFY
ncbi:MFS general substrate transporter [Cystobasidium minutum MCA 4210]|uniref:MFS general substrate transporter n=1 Tax=Cystobasidium minutum MCA 4210 TaxID=1397322 RepID=UPI0034D0128F|eukprot:jgi/Rhomi1/55729/CE55728_592